MLGRSSGKQHALPAYMSLGLDGLTARRIQHWLGVASSGREKCRRSWMECFGYGTWGSP